jgi:hypothetical protein
LTGKKVQKEKKYNISPSLESQGVIGGQMGDDLIGFKSPWFG